MDQNIALEALSALTGCTVKPCPAGGAQDSPGLRDGFPACINSQTARDYQPAVQDIGLNGFTPPNELTIESLISTIFLHDIFQSLRSTGGPVLGSSGGPVLGSSGGPVLESIANQVKCSLLSEISISGSSLLYIPPLQKDMDKKKETSINVEKFFSPRHNYDFRRSKDPSECLRGGEPYTRPWGWYRFALKVKNKYPEGNTWLGSPGWRDDSSPGEWPVSFHGTGLQGAIGITEGHYEPGDREKYGYGIYSTPNIKTAEAYALKKKFTSKTDGKTYEVVMQNRINPEKRERTKKKDYWLIRIDPNATAEEVKKIVTESIRPYGILIKEV